MRKIFMVSLLGMLAVLLYRRCESPPKQEQVAPSQTAQPEVQDSEPRRATEHARGAVERVAESPPRLPDHGEMPRVVFDRGHRKDGEHLDRYRDRVWFAKRFDAFVRESGVTEEQVQELLLALYDYTTQRRRAMDMLREDVSQGGIVDGEYVDAVFGDDLHRFMLALQRILDMEQSRIYFKHCLSCAQEISYYTHYEPILRLEGESADENAR